MDIRNYIRPIIAGLVGIGLVVLVIILLVKAFSGGSAAPEKSINLVHYASTEASAELYIDGPVRLDQEHQAVKITVDRTQTEIDIIQGYQGTITQSQTYDNNSAAYAAFLQALNHLSFTKGDNSTANQDERGYCPAGDRYIYTFNDGTKNLFRFWSTSCGQGTFKGSSQAVRQLFARQIPERDFNHLTSNIPLGG